MFLQQLANVLRQGVLMQAAPAKAVKVVEPQKEKRLPAAKRRQIEARQDAEDFAAEYCMLKKVKKGKMSEVRTSPVKAS